METPNDGAIAVQQASETDLGSSGVGTAPGTGDLCCGVVSSKAVDDASEQYLRCDDEVPNALDTDSCLGSVEALEKSDVSSDLGTDNVSNERDIFSRFSTADEVPGDEEICSGAGTIDVPGDQGLCLSLANSALSDLSSIHGVGVMPDENACSNPVKALVENDPSRDIGEIEAIGEPETPKPSDSSHADYWPVDESGHLSDNEEQAEFSDIPTPLTSPRVSSNGSNSPYPENEKEMVGPKESEENWDLDETTAAATSYQHELNFSYFKVDRDVNGLFEHSELIVWLPGTSLDGPWSSVFLLL